MNTLYKVVDDIKQILEAEPMVKTVTYGDIDDIDLSKPIYPLAHTMIGDATIQERTIVIDMVLILMDLVTVIDAKPNELDVLNTQLNIAARFDAILKRNILYKNGYELQGDIQCEPFNERFEQNVSGFTCSFQIALKNEMTSC